MPKLWSLPPQNVQFYLPTEAEIVRDEEEKRKAKMGADWICAFCGTQNKISTKHCENCGNDRNASEDKQLQTKTYGLDEVPVDSKDARNLQKQARGLSGDSPPPCSICKKRKPNKWLIGILVTVGLSLLILLILNLR